jgi:hypothetical protein
MAVSDSDVMSELTAGGASIEDYFVIGHDICAVNSSGELTSLLIEEVPGEEEGEMYNAVLNFLLRRGARVYHSYEEYNEEARS